MRMKLILPFFISALILAGHAKAQQQEVLPDSLSKTNIYGLRLGLDLSKLARTAFEDGYTGFEIQGDFRFSERFWAALELGTEEREWDEVNLQSRATGSYAKLGVDFNAYQNWIGMNNMIYFGLRYGFATFEQELLAYSIYTTDPTFPAELKTDPITYDGLSASWLELVFGVKTEVWNNIFLGVNLQLKRLLSEDRPENFDNLIIPGYNRTYDFSEFGAGYGFTVSYLIPIFRK
ncbi:DUF6048 family protein [Aureitalea marina]|uniref:Outer membrane protein beta-barrel domain-containing protein n=1 Tax=Aureitalea marina TaxID=930804 RepID=A0A2S7KNS4_9FLAO|nr:DUF6048 family protein [Aureitalea marina]PQB04271.1 hypothetical protein BST85_04670 [Aureitalea marina]